MKKWLWGSFLLFSAFILWGAEENLVMNGGFEELFGGVPQSWTTSGWKTQRMDTLFSVGTQNPEEGKQYAVIKNITDNDARFVQRIMVKPETVYMLSCWIRANVVTSGKIGASITIMAKDFSSYSRNFDNTAGKWEYVEFYVRTGSKQTSMEVCARLGGFGSTVIGEAHFDDFRVVEVTDPGVNNVVNIETGSIETGKSTSAILGVIVIFGIIALAGIAFFVFFNIRKGNSSTIKISGEDGSSQTLEKTALEMQGKQKYTLKDLLFIGPLTLIYAVVAFTNLGSFIAPQTYWRPAITGENFYVEFESPKNVKKIYYYSGVPNHHQRGKFRIETSMDGKNWTYSSSFDVASIFYWHILHTNFQASFVRISAEVPNVQLMEIAFFEANSETPLKIKKIYAPMTSSFTEGSPQNTIDEPDTIAFRPNMMRGMTPGFDEIYHARTAYEHIKHYVTYETTHPPLGKDLIALGILIFGMVPFGWRFMGTLMGVLMVPAMYALGKEMFKKEEFAFYCSFIFAWDFMHFTQTRITTIDSYPVFFIMLMYYFMYQYFTMDFIKTEFKKTLLPLLFCGLSWGLGIASKWISINAGMGLALLFFVTLARQISEHGYYAKRLKNNAKSFTEKELLQTREFVNRFGGRVGLTLGWCVLVFIVIPGIIYFLSYIPFILVPEPGHGIDGVFKNQTDMFNYHSQIKETHPFSSTWYQWPAVWKPMWYYNGSGLPPGKTERVVAMGNPALWWLGSLAGLGLIILTFVKFILRVIHKSTPENKHKAYSFLVSRNERTGFFIGIAYLAQYLPWIISPRKLTFIYHYFASVPFITLALVYFIKMLLDFCGRVKPEEQAVFEAQGETSAEDLPDPRERARKRLFLARGGVLLYLAIVLGLFIMFYPVIAGIIVDANYAKSLKWFSNWPVG